MYLADQTGAIMREMDGNHDATGNDVDAALDRIEAAFLERSRRIATGTKRSFVVTAAAMVISAPFMMGMPLHRLFVPWGQMSLVVCALAFAVALWHAALFIDDYLDRRRIDKERRSW